MSGQEGLGRLFNVVPIAAGIGISLQDAAGITFVCTGDDTFTITVADTFAGSYAAPTATGGIITRKYTNTATDGSAAWVEATQDAANAVSIDAGTVVFYVGGPMLPDTKVYVKCAVAAAGLVEAIVHDLNIQRTPANLPALGA